MPYQMATEGLDPSYVGVSATNVLWAAEIPQAWQQM
jgi:hypothetical protein